MDKFVLTSAYGKTVGLLIENEKAAELRVYEEESRLGNIYVGRVSNVVKNINAAFVDIEKGLSCYMSLEELPEDYSIKTGSEIVVQLSKEGVKTKQPTVTPRISLTGKYVVLSLYQVKGVSAKIKDNEQRKKLKAVLCDTISSCIEDMNLSSQSPSVKNILSQIGGVVRTQAEEASLDLIEEEIKELFESFCKLLHKALHSTIYSIIKKNNSPYIDDALYFYDNGIEVITDIEDAGCTLADITKDEAVIYKDSSYPLFARYNVTNTIEKALLKKVYLRSGAYLVIEYTEAMTVIDVNSGKAIKGNDVSLSMHSINLEAASEIARQLRLRNISGIIMVDFININDESMNRELLKVLASYTDKDYTKTKVIDMTKLGLVEITRKKVRKPIYEALKNDN